MRMGARTMPAAKSAYISATSSTVRSPSGSYQVWAEAHSVTSAKAVTRTSSKSNVPLREQPVQVAEQEVDVQAALVRLVDDDRVVAAQQPVAPDLGEQQAVGHQPDARLG